MNQTYLEHVRDAKESLTIWISNVEQMHNGFQMFSKENDLDRNNSDFAKWYYGEGQTFVSFKEFNLLEAFYDEMYDLFLEYVDLDNTPVKKALFSNQADKRKSELSALFVSLKKAARKLIKSVEIFEEKLVKSPLFNSALELDNTVVSKTYDKNKTETVKPVEKKLNLKDKVVERAKKPVSENVELESKQEHSTKNTQSSDVDFEKRVQDEVTKIKNQLETEFTNKKNDEPKEKASHPKTKSQPKEKALHPKTKSEPKDDPAINLDEEMRRILS